MEIITEAFLDSIKIFPMLFVVYYLIEFAEHKENNRIYHMLMRSNRSGPLLGALFGCVPQCGFSVIASSLHAKRAITIGTLMAVFIATSDEAVPILLSHPDMFGNMMWLILIKLVVAVFVGILVDLFVQSKAKSNAGCSKKHEHSHFHGNCESCDKGIFRAALVHSVKIFALIFVFSAVTDFFVDLIGEDVISAYLAQNGALQPFIAATVGLIPNCAASVILTQLYVAGALSFGALAGGLCVGAGVGFAVLFKENKNLKQNVFIVLGLYAIGVLTGFVVNLF